jgi:hypothetical protein
MQKIDIKNDVKREGIVGYIAFINGSGFTVEIDDDGAHIVKSVITCEMCGDDRVFKNGTCFVCSELIKHD